MSERGDQRLRRCGETVSTQPDGESQPTVMGG